MKRTACLHDIRSIFSFDNRRPLLLTPVNFVETPVNFGYPDFDVIKIDMKFLSAKATHNIKKSKVIIASIVDMAKKLGIHTLCEGVETKENLDFLKEVGCEKIQGYYFSKPLSYSDLREHFGAVREQPNDREYMEQIGRINILARNPIQWSNYDDSPMVLFEYDGKELHLRNSNAAFSKSLYGVDKDPKMVDSYLNNINTKLMKQFVSAAEQSKKTHHPETVDTVLNGEYYTIAVNHVARKKDSNLQMIFAQAMNLSTLSNFDNASLRESALRSLYSLFDCIALFDLENNTINRIFKNSGTYVGDYQDLTPLEAVKSYAQVNIHPDDQAAFLDFYDFSTVKQRIKSSGQRYIANFFRAKDVNGEYHVQIHMLISALLDHHETVIVLFLQGDSNVSKYYETVIKSNPNRVKDDTVITIDEQVLENVLTKDTQFRPVELLESLLNLIHSEVFWKDRNRRFLGANNRFKEYYEFSDNSKFIGKNDEEMNWHVSDAPSHDDESEVLKKGKVIDGKTRQIISHGQIRTIKVYKAPVYRNDKIIGLVGYFDDVTENQKMMFIDNTTKLLSPQGLRNSFQDYYKEWKFAKKDFGIIRIDVDSFNTLNQNNEQEKADHILKEISKCLVDNGGECCTIGRADENQFIILRQIESKKELDAIKKKILSAIGRLKISVTDKEPIGINATEFVYSQLTDNERQELFNESMMLK